LSVTDMEALTPDERLAAVRARTITDWAGLEGARSVRSAVAPCSGTTPLPRRRRAAVRGDPLTGERGAGLRLLLHEITRPGRTNPTDVGASANHSTPAPGATWGRAARELAGGAGCSVTARRSSPSSQRCRSRPRPVCRSRSSCVGQPRPASSVATAGRWPDRSKTDRPPGDPRCRQGLHKVPGPPHSPYRSSWSAPSVAAVIRGRDKSWGSFDTGAILSRDGP